MAAHCRTKIEKFLENQWQNFPLPQPFATDWRLFGGNSGNRSVFMILPWERLVFRNLGSAEPL